MIHANLSVTTASSDRKSLLSPSRYDHQISACLIRRLSGYGMKILVRLAGIRGLGERQLDKLKLWDVERSRSISEKHLIDVGLVETLAFVVGRSGRRCRIQRGRNFSDERGAERCSTARTSV